ncbi:MAG: hypothetical protein ACYCU0_06395 [Solirubrobacteraceae bacterium]
MQRTLVKSPPELWAELSDEAALERHLSLEGLRLTLREPERLLEWETDDARGRIELSQSGWGTKVKLSLERELAEPIADGQIEAAVPESHPLQTDPKDDPAAETHRDDDGEAPPAQPDATAPQREPRRGLLARLFRRRGKRADPIRGHDTARCEAEAQPPEAQPPKAQPPETQPPETQPPDAQPPDAQPPEAQPLDAQPEAPRAPARERAEQEPDQRSTEQPRSDRAEPDAAQRSTPDLTAELREAEQRFVAESEALLSGVLDRLGAAHHRPFSRA